MTDQYLVEFEGVRLTRLPVGRAEGFVWLTFVGRGEDLRYTLTHSSDWRIQDHVSARWPSGEVARVIDRHISGADGMSSFSSAIRDTGEPSIVLTYVGADSILAEEVVSIPA